MVKKDFHWMLYDVKSKKVLMDQIKDVSFIRNAPQDKLAIVRQNLNYGVIHNAKGTVIPFNFSDIVNVGSAEKPLYFTEKKVEEAPLFIVIYFNSQGQSLRTEVYDQDDYDKIYCDH
jgi:hypothetical protein